MTVKVIIILFVVLAAGSALWWGMTGLTPQEQLDYIEAKFHSESVSNTADSASKLGKVLKHSFDEAQDVYENGAEAKYE